MGVAKAWDKAKVEKAGLQAEHRLLAPLRHPTSFSLTELNEAAAEAGLVRGTLTTRSPGG